MTVRVLLVDDHAMLRQGLRTLLDREEGIEVVGEAADGRTALRKVKELAPHLVVLDVMMPGLNGIETAQRLARDHPDVKVLVLSMHDDERFVDRMFRAGAKGYLLKDCEYADILDAVRGIVLHGRTHLCSRISRRVLDRFRDLARQGPGGAPPPLLTDREQRVLRLLADGASTSDVAEAVGLSVKWVQMCRQTLMGKLGVGDMANLVKAALREGLLDGPA